MNMMKKILASFLFFTFLWLGAWAQKIAYVNTEYVLKHIPEYYSGQQQLNRLSDQWEKEIQTRYAEIDRLYKEYQAEQVLLTADMKKEREEEIVEKEKAVKEFQNNKFGYQGELFKKRQELIKPVQDKMFAVIQKQAEENKYDFVFDRSSQVGMLYANTKLDISDQVVVALGHKPGVFAGADR